MDPKAVIERNFAEYRGYRDQALEAYAAGDSRTACFFADIAARVAAHRHCGIYSSPVLERMLIDIGRRLPDASNYSRPQIEVGDAKRVLHVLSELVEVGGHSRMAARWMTTDSDRTHSLAVTSHFGDLPEMFEEAVGKAGGEIYRIDKSHARVEDRALALRGIAREHDLIVLHVYSEDVVPMLAFSNSSRTPPVLLLNHADHMFWMGASISDVVINLRDAATRLAIKRRGLSPDRDYMVPTLVSETKRERSRLEAKRALGLPEDEVLIFSAARAAKYRTMGDQTFADVHTPVLQAHPNARLVVLGCGDMPDWAPAIEATDGRIVPLAPIPNPKPWFEAADIYVDSFPFVSSTSMMEAAGYGCPMVTRFYAPQDAEIVGINHPGLIDGSLHMTNDQDYQSVVGRLISDLAYREACGQMAQDAVARHHLPGPWLQRTVEAYALALKLPPLDNCAVFSPVAEDEMMTGEPDIRMNEMFGSNYKMCWHIRDRLKELPVPERIRTARTLWKEGAFDRRRDLLGPFVPKSLARALNVAT